MPACPSDGCHVSEWCGPFWYLDAGALVCLCVFFVSPRACMCVGLFVRVCVFLSVCVCVLVCICVIMCQLCGSHPAVLPERTCWPARLWSTPWVTPELRIWTWPCSTETEVTHTQRHKHTHIQTDRHTDRQIGTHRTSHIARPTHAPTLHPHYTHTHPHTLTHAYTHTHKKALKHGRVMLFGGWRLYTTLVAAGTTL